jgi:hypothetical protein
MPEDTQLILGVKDLLPSYQKTPPTEPRFYHFHCSAKDFHQADIIIFRQDNKPDYVIKDRHGRLEKKA